MFERIVVLLLGLVVLLPENTLAAARPNVLLITIDDLNDWTGCLGGHPQARTPQIDRLADRGVLFTNAHCQAPICNPSRTSFMLGLRPSTTGIYQNSPWFRTTPRNQDRVSVAQHFGEQGYRTLTTGKIYHGSKVDEPSFETVGPRPGQRLKIDTRLIDELNGLWDFGPQQYPEDQAGDHVDATWTIERLADVDEQPFFLAVGLYRPHVPFYAPQSYFDERPRDEVVLPIVKEDDRDDLPPAAIELTANSTPPAHEWFVKNDLWKDAVQAYLASTTFTDAQVGRILDALDASPHAGNTIVVLLSDHGFHLGEKQRWAKQSLWERSTRVPYIISVPDGVRGRRCEAPVELLSLFPTLVELCDLPMPEGLEGASVTPLLSDPEAKWDRPAITTYGQNNHSVRSRDFRYIRYADGSEELYDHRTDPREWENVADHPELADVIQEHSRWLPEINSAPARGTNKKRAR